jgi:DNA polymerase-1
MNVVTKKGYAYAIDLEKNSDIVPHILQLCYLSKKCVFWNAKFDMHMLYNFGTPYLARNVTDAMIYVRLAHDAIPVSAGGVPMSLKEYSYRFISKEAKYWLNKIDKLKTDAKRAKTAFIKDRFKKLGIKMTIAQLEQFQKDLTNEFTDLPPLVQQVLTEADEQISDPNRYDFLDRDTVLSYACYDTMFTLEAFYQTRLETKRRGQINVAEVEEELIYVLFKQERVGLKFDREYVLRCKERLKAYILEKRKQLCELAGQPIKVGQHAAMKKIFLNKFNLNLPATNEKELSLVHTYGNEKATEFANLVIQLRTLEKWYSTYIIKWLNETTHTDRIYTEINQVGAVSGRLSCNFQQFPREPLLDDNGNELFHVRRMILADDDMNLVFIDFAAEELRFQAIYTILTGTPDVNLLRCFIPYQCQEINGKYYLEDGSEWTALDPHALTTKKAFGIDESHPEWKHYRSMGKSTNFACNYNASEKTLMSQFHYTEEVAKKLHKAYSETFKGVVAYRKYVKQYLYTHPYIENLFGRRYYGASWHNCSNYLVQGSSADYLKQKMIEIDKFLEPYKARIVISIHDEILYNIPNDEMFLIPHIKQIMEDLPNSPVPIVAEVEVTTTSWAEKRKYLDSTQVEKEPVVGV